MEIDFALLMEQGMDIIPTKLGLVVGKLYTHNLNGFPKVSVLSLAKREVCRSLQFLLGLLLTIFTHSKLSQTDRELKGRKLRDHRRIIFASLYIIYNHKKQNGRDLFIGAKSMPYHRSKKVLFLPYLSFETKKSFLVGGGGG